MVWAPPNQKSWLRLWLNDYLPQVTVTSDVIGQFYVRLFFAFELVLVMIRVDAKFRLWVWLALSLNLTFNLSLTYFDVRFVTSDVIATGRKYRYRFATGAKLILFKHILSSILVNNRVIVIENRQKNFSITIFIDFWKCSITIIITIQQNRVINYNSVNHNYNFFSSLLRIFKNVLRGISLPWILRGLFPPRKIKEFEKT